MQVYENKKLSGRRETVRRFVSLNILLSHWRSLKVIRSDTIEYNETQCRQVVMQLPHSSHQTYPPPAHSVGGPDVSLQFDKQSARLL